MCLIFSWKCKHCIEIFKSKFRHNRRSRNGTFLRFSIENSWNQFSVKVHTNSLTNSHLFSRKFCKKCARANLSDFHARWQIFYQNFVKSTGTYNVKWIHEIFFKWVKFFFHTVRQLLVIVESDYLLRYRSRRLDFTKKMYKKYVFCILSNITQSRLQDFQ